MADLEKLNDLRSFNRRNSYVTNAIDIISPAIKKQLKEYEYDSDSETDSDPENVEEYSDQSSENSENSEDSDHLKSNAYSYVPKEYETNTSSDEDSHDENEEDTKSSGDKENQDMDERDIEENKQTDNLVNVPPLDFENLNDHHNPKSHLKNKSNPQTDSTYLNRVFTNLEKNLSDVRIEYQVSLSNSALESSVRRKNCRLSHTNSLSNSSLSSKPKENDTSTSNHTSSKKDKEKNGDHSSTSKNKDKSNVVKKGSKEFNLNKWFDELPDGLKNFVELESSSRDPELKQPLSLPKESLKLKQNLRNMGSRNMYLQNITRPLKRQTLVSSVHTDDTGDDEVEEEDYIDILKKDYIEPIKEVFNEDLKKELKNDFKNLKNELVELYNKSPKILQDFIKSSKNLTKFGSKEDPKATEDTDKKHEEEKLNEEDVKDLRSNLNLYYLETNRNNGYTDSLNKTAKNRNEVHYDSDSSGRVKETVLKSKKDVNKYVLKSEDYKVYNIFDKYEYFDITDQPKLTHVSSFDINRNNLNQNNKNSSKNKDVDEDNEEEDEDMGEDNEKVIKSIGEYNIGFLSSLSRVNEKYELLKDYQVNSNLIKPWFLNPLNEKLQSQAMCDQKQSESNRFNRNKEDKNYVISNKNNDESIKYIINKENENIKYLIDEVDTELPNKDLKNQEKERYINLYQLENYYNDVDFDPNDSDRNKFYDPILHFKNYEDKKKKSVNHTDWATFGRPLVKRIH